MVDTPHSPDAALPLDAAMPPDAALPSDSEASQLTAAAAAARLGIKRATLYAYVSRGLLTRTVSMDGRTSLFDPREVDHLRRNRRRSASGELTTVITSSVTKIDEAGHQYRGVPVLDQLDDGFEHVADRLWASTGSWELDEATADLIRRVINELPIDAPVIDRFRIAVAIASATDPRRAAATTERQTAAGRRMIAAEIESLVAGPTTDLAGSVVDDRRIASRLFAGLTAESSRAPSESQQATLDVALTLLIDHGLAASTFAARIAASVRADPYSVVAAGLGPIGGALHGAASVGVHRLLQEAATVGPDVAVDRRLAVGDRLAGVGHTIYQRSDPRETVLLDHIRSAWNADPRLALVEDVRHSMSAAVDHPVNIDFAIGSLTWLAAMPEWAGEAIFGCARTVGWVAHGIEEFGERPVRFRPSARYVEPVDVSSNRRGIDTV